MFRQCAFKCGGEWYAIRNLFKKLSPSKEFGEDVWEGQKLKFLKTAAIYSIDLQR